MDIILCFDNDEAGRKATIRTGIMINNFLRNEANYIRACERLGIVPLEEPENWECPPYHKFIYDPFEIFHPSKIFIREKIKELKQQAYDLLNAKNTFQPDWFADISWTERLEPKHKKLCSRIRNYEWRLRNGNNPSASDNGRIGESDIQKAKDTPIAEFFVGNLRKSGKTAVGLCPFHEEKTGSFTIFDNNRFTCFGCGRRGDCIDFVQGLNGLKFIEAVKQICRYNK